MKKQFLLLVLSVCYCVKCFSQDIPDPIAYKLKDSRDKKIRIYQNPTGVLNTDIYKIWNSDYDFTTDGTVTIRNVVYTKLIIPDGDQTIRLNPTVWTGSGAYVDKNDFNCYLYILKDDFDKFKLDEYPRYYGRGVFSVLTIPFKIRTATDGHPSSLYNSNYNIGTFLGYRIGTSNKGGVTIGGMLGFNSLDQNKSNNNAITDASSQAMTGANYGFGLIVDVAKQIQIGAVVGWDHGFGDLSTTYLYQDKAWFAVSLNFNFINFGTTHNQ